MPMHDYASESTVVAVIASSVVTNGAQTTAAVDIGDARQAYLMVSMTVTTTDDYTAVAVQDSADNGVNDAWALHTTVGTIGVGGTELNLTELTNIKRFVRLVITGAAATADSYVCALIIADRDVRI